MSSLDTLRTDILFWPQLTYSKKHAGQQITYLKKHAGPQLTYLKSFLSSPVRKRDGRFTG
ncbi:hypothetical protein L9F63_027255, partial [Diploptera punctata]